MSTTLLFPGRVIKAGEQDRNIVLVIQRRLNQMGCGPVEQDGAFDDETENAVRLFQARFTDLDGLPLKIDGKVGSLTWGALFGDQSVPAVTESASPLLERVLEVAASQIGVMEQPLGSNRGPKVDEYLRAVGLNPATGSFPWCVAFVYWCFERAARDLHRSNPMIKTAGVLDHWNRASDQRIPRLSLQKALSRPALVKPGLVFVIDTPPPGGGGHSGLVERVEQGKLVSIEGNTNDGGSREGIGVFRRFKRKIGEINKGFIDYSNL